MLDAAHSALPMNGFALNFLDWIWIGTYFVCVYGIAVWAARGHKNSADYFLAGRGISWFVVGASLFATNIGTEHLVGLAASGYEGGLAVGHYEWLASLIVLILGWVFVPFYLNSKVVTMPEFLERRYNPYCRAYLSLISVVGYVFTKISVILFAGSLILEQMLGWNLWASAIAVIVLTGLYTLLGGLRAVLYTDFLQAIVLVLGAVLLVVFGLNEIGGLSALRSDVPSEFYSMFKPMDHPEFPWTGIVFGAPILGIWYWCTDQFIVQRVLSAHGIKEAQRGTVFAGYLKILPVFLMVVPGIIGFVLVQNGVFEVENPNQVYPLLVANILPSGIKGLVVAGLLAALMSSLSSTFNSCSTLVTFDLYKRLRPHAGDRELVNVGRAAVGGLMVIGLLWIPFIDPQTSLFQYLQAVQAYIAPPIAAVFLFGLLVPRLNGSGALASLLTGFVLGGARFLLENFFDTRETGMLGFLVHIHFLHFAAILFGICLLVLVVVSFVTRAPGPEQRRGLTFAETDFKWQADPLNVALSIVLVGLIATFYTIFF